jgi:hypothetical protein
MAVVWSLPNEILSHIFELGVIGEEYVVSNSRKDDIRLPFNILVSHVSRTFREVAIHTPRLWSQVQIFHVEPPELEYLRTCLQRSGSLKADISLSCIDDDFDAGLEPIHLFMDIIMPHIHRLRMLSVRLCGPHVLYLVVQLLNKPAPELEVLELSDYDYEHTNDINDPHPATPPGEPLTLFGGITPKLEAITLLATYVAWPQCNFPSLTELFMGYHTRDVRPRYGVFKTMIEASPALHSLHLRGSAPLTSNDATGVSFYPPLRMEQLKNLHISEIPSDCATPLIALFNAPNVTSLSLTDLNTDNYSEFILRIIGPPTRFPALTKLKLASVAVDDTIIEDLFRTFSKLTHLTMYFDRMPPYLLRYLEPKGPENVVLCPKLECFKCIGATSFDLKTLVERRRDVGYPIPTLQLDELSSIEMIDSMGWLRENVIVEIVERSDIDSDDMGDTGSGWSTGEGDDIVPPFFSLLQGFTDEVQGFTDEEDEDEDEDDDDEEEEGDGDGGGYDEDEDASDMEVDASGSEGE